MTLPARAGRWLLPCLLAAPMLLVAGFLDSTSVLFPEGLALAAGAWVLGRPDWIASPMRIAVLPPLCAAAGVGVSTLGLPRWLGVVVALTVATAVVQAAGGRLGPALAAAVLPVVFAERSWVYPLAVAVVCAAVAIVVAATRRHDLATRPQRWPWLPLVAFWAVVTGWTVLAGVLLDLPALVLAPPLLVACLEWMMGGARRPVTALRRWGLLVVAGVLGASALRWVPALWVGGTLAVAVVAVLAALLDEPHPPALATALVPFVAADSDPFRVGLAFAAGAAALYLGGWAVLVAAEWLRVLVRRLRPGAA